jgi:hypothetical protein
MKEGNGMNGATRSDLNFKLSRYDRDVFRVLAALHGLQLRELLTRMVEVWGREHPLEYRRARAAAARLTSNAPPGRARRGNGSD